MKTAFIFPGQGSQEVGMGQALAAAYPAARQVFEEVDDALGERLSDVIWNGPAEALTLTANTQPALMAASLAALRALESEVGPAAWDDVAYVAGHSLGEYSALAAAGAISIADAARLLRLRGDAMQAAVPVGNGAMAVLLGADIEIGRRIAAAAADEEICEPANDNAPGQVVVSGHRGAVERAMALCKSHGVKRAMLLPVSAPFHSTLMKPAGEVMRAALAATRIAVPRVPVISNVLASAISDPDEIRRTLVEQVSATVRWRECMAYMGTQGVRRFIELGSGHVLTGLVRRILPDADASRIGTPEGLAAFHPAAALQPALQEG